MDQLSPNSNNSTKSKRGIFLGLGGLILMIGIIGYYFFVPPFYDLGGEGITIELDKGVSAFQVARILKSGHVISSDTLFVALVSFLRDENSITPGTYLFKSPLSIMQAARRVTRGDFGIPAKKITIPEGFTNREIANRLEAGLVHFDKTLFLDLASTSEGYLYPETYFFISSDNEDIIFNKMVRTFKEKTLSLHDDFETSLRSKEEIIIMASILEMEVQSKEDKKMVSGILWNRIKIGMPLQVDASLAYERDKDSYTLTTEDLRKDSKYNTYTRRGLPPTPISNPGFDAIEAALKPTPSQYLYFLTDKAGKVYYAKTYEEHLKNKAKYFGK